MSKQEIEDLLVLYKIRTLYNCQYCPVNAEVKRDAKHHIIESHDQSMSRIKAYQGDMISKVDYYRSFKCSMCERAFRKKVDIIEHYKGKHEDMKGHKCLLCPFTSAYRKHMKRHVATIH